MMSTVNEQFNDLLEELDKDYDNFYIEKLSLYSKEDKTLEGIIKIINCKDDMMCVRVWVIKLHKWIESPMIRTDNLTDAQEREKIAALLSAINDELN